MEPWAQFHSDLTIEDVLAQVSIPQDTGDGLVAVSESRVAHAQNLGLAEQVSLDAHLLLHQHLPLSLEDEGSGRSDSDVCTMRMPIARKSFVDIQFNNELIAPACSASPGHVGMEGATRPKNPEPVSPIPCHLHEANDEVMADKLVDVAVDAPGNVASEVPSSACSGVRSQMPHMSTDSDVDAEMLASGRVASKEAPSDHLLPIRAPNPEPWKPSELASKLDIIESQENLDGDVCAAMLRAEPGAAEHCNGSLMPAVDRPQNPEPWLPSNAASRHHGVEGDEAKAAVVILHDEQNRLLSRDASADAAQEQLHNTVMCLFRRAQEAEFHQRQRALGCERALAIARAVAGREQHIKVLHAKIAAVHRKVAEREESASQLECTLHVLRQQANDLTAHLEAIRRHISSFEMHCRSEQKDWQDTPMKTTIRSLPLDTSLKSATSEQSTTCSVQDLGLRVSLLPEMASESLGCVWRCLG